MTLGLAMIVRDEAMVIERCLNSVKDHIDYYTIVDTGSRDFTPAIIQRFFEAEGIPGEIHFSEWKNFAENRTELLAFARDKTDWILTLDADTTLTSVGDLPRGSEAAYVHFTGPLDWALPWILSGRHEWHYEGYAHEYIVSDAPFLTDPGIGWTVAHHADGGNQIGKFQRYLDLLLQDDKDTPNSPRTVFYIARTYLDLGNTSEAIKWFRKRIPLGGFAEEVFISQFYIGMLLGSTHDLLLAWNMRPNRSEPLFELAKHWRLAGQFHVARAFADLGLTIPYPNDLLFIDRTVYDYGMLFERSISAWWAGDKDTCKNDSQLLLTRDIPQNVRDAVNANLQFC